MMPTQEVLILASTKMLSGICTAGLSCDLAPTTGLCWIRPTREFGTALPGDRMGEGSRLTTVGLSREWQGEYWPLVHAVHVVPDYTATIDLDRL
jgi:hypothetical protein